MTPAISPETADQFSDQFVGHNIFDDHFTLIDHLFLECCGQMVHVWPDLQSEGINIKSEDMVKMLGINIDKKN